MSSLNVLSPVCEKMFDLVMALSECYINSKRWKKLIQSRGRSFIFSTAMPVPIAAAAHGTPYIFLSNASFVDKLLIIIIFMFILNKGS